MLLESRRVSTPWQILSVRDGGGQINLERSAMSFLIEKSVLRRRFVLALLIVSMLGPWSFDLLNVPAQYPCGKPSVRLYGDFCGYPMPGFAGVLWAAGSSFTMLDALIRGNSAGRLPELLSTISAWIILLPFFSILFLIGNPGSRRLQGINLIAWGLAGLVTLAAIVLQTSREQVGLFFYLLWGLWLYLLLAIGTTLFEILAWRSKFQPGLKG